MSILYSIFRNFWNDFKRWYKVKFIYPHSSSYNKIKSFINPDLEIKNGVVIEERVQLSPALKTIGEYVYIANNTYVGNCESIGSFTSISFDVKIGLINHPLHFVSTSPVFYAKRRGWVSENTFNERGEKPVLIGNDVLISAGAIILAGVHIGDGAVIGAGAVVTKDVAPYSIVAGVPAKHLRFRFDESTRNELLKSEWWRDPKKVKEFVAYANSPKEFLAKL